MLHIRAFSNTFVPESKYKSRPYAYSVSVSSWNTCYIYVDCTYIRTTLAFIWYNLNVELNIYSRYKYVGTWTAQSQQVFALGQSTGQTATRLYCKKILTSLFYSIPTPTNWQNRFAPKSQVLGGVVGWIPIRMIDKNFLRSGNMRVQTASFLLIPGKRHANEM